MVVLCGQLFMYLEEVFYIFLSFYGHFPTLHDLLYHFLGIFYVFSGCFDHSVSEVIQ